MDRSEARRQADSIILAASTQPDYQFTDTDFQTRGADGPGDDRALMGGLLAVANALGVPLDETNPTAVDTAAVNRVIAACREKLKQLGGDPGEHLRAIAQRR